MPFIKVHSRSSLLSRTCMVHCMRPSHLFWISTSQTWETPWGTLQHQTRSFGPNPLLHKLTLGKPYIQEHEFQKERICAQFGPKYQTVNQISYCFQRCFTWNWLRCYGRKLCQRLYPATLPAAWCCKSIACQDPSKNCSHGDIWINGNFHHWIFWIHLPQDRTTGGACDDLLVATNTSRPLPMSSMPCLTGSKELHVKWMQSGKGSANFVVRVAA